MDWLIELITGTGIAHSIMVLALVISVGLLLGKVKVFGISLGTTWILFFGIFLGHLGLEIDHNVLHFLKEFGLILFIFSIGMQVGPSFFSSFKQGGITLNLLASGVVFLGVITTWIIHVVTGIPIATMVGILSGAVTNTPGLGAAQQTYTDITGTVDPNIATAYAVAYPLGVVGIILSIVLFKYIFRINFAKENSELDNESESKLTEANMFSLQVENPAIFGKNIRDIKHLIDKEFVISRLLNARTQELVVPQTLTVLNEGDKVLVVTNLKNIEVIEVFIGKRIEMGREEWNKLDSQLISRRISITKSAINGRSIGNLRLRNLFGVNITRVNRAGVDLIADSRLQLQLGDRVTVVGSEESIANVEKFLGNSLKRLREPNLISIFVGIALGVIVGSIPFIIPGIPQPVKLGLAGGPLIVAILLSKFGPKYKLVTYTTMSANLMLREIGIAIFLACVGLGAGENFVETVINGGYMWIGYGAIITVLPLLIVGVIGRKACKLNYFTLMGLIAGSMTDPPALSFANATAGNDIPAVSYATVYPLTMFLRVITAQLLILIFL
ncbi:MAG: putative transporter [Proteiniphilum sp.]|jgi:putative transport protein|nr:putative transporter [Proteiniphilum sp.]MDD3076382.1 putative transporter [Proteiniphilum sp.]MDD3778633.1 putative transporter [Proteiniphilum sp.]MDD3956424.1 putative transporter [Proteiniphilum sp.]NCB24509.1 putative transporter [Bacteroidia bacterium]